MVQLAQLGLYVLLGLGALIGVVALSRALRGNMDLVGLHMREAVRHIIAGVLMLGTLAGTMWTFSDGKLTLDANLETLVSVGGISAALDVGAIFFGLAIQQLEIRIKTAKRGEQRAEYLARRILYYRWFAAVVSMSFLANVWFRWHQLGAGWTLEQVGNDFAVLLTSATIPLLVCVFTIVLQPLHPDYEEMGRQATQRGLVTLIRSSQQVFMRHLRDMGRGRTLEPEAMKQLALTASLLGMYAGRNEQQTLDYAIHQGVGATAVDGTVEEMLSSADVERIWGVPRRTAQLWVSSVQGRRKAGKGNAWLAPESAIIAQHGRPSLQLVAPRTRKARQGAASGPQTPADQAQDNETDSATEAHIAASEPQERIEAWPAHEHSC